MDPQSAANFEEIVIEHVKVIWDVDFDQKIFYGKAFLSAVAVKDTDKIVLDARDLYIREIKAGSVALKYKVEDFYEVGQKLTIEFETKLLKGEKKKLEITYLSNKNATAYQFMDKEQTTDKTHPFLYSQCQSIHARSFLPCMDTPSVKQTYSAEVTVPKGLTCLMSALSKGSTDFDNGKVLFRFEQPVPIPIYLIAIVVGALEKRDLSDRCCVWAEPSVADKAQWEFEDTERILQTAEKLMGKYEWGRYDLVVLPPTFPFGGMENPCLTFVTPALLVGDRSLVNVLAHEITHSWTGNLVTNANWEHFWLNEGFTIFVERKILGRLYGKEVREFDCITGWEDELYDTIEFEFSPVHEYTKLILSFPGIDPDDAFSRIPYEKGSAFLLYLEQQLGSEERFEQMLREYVQKFRLKSLFTDDFLQFLREFFKDKSDVLEKVDFNSWLYEPGFPSQKPVYNESLIKECVLLANQWTEFSIDALKQVDSSVFEKLPSAQQIKVLNLIHKAPALSHDRFELLSKKYKLNESHNCELLTPYLQIGIKAKFPQIIPKACEFVCSIGRGRYIKPIYTELLKWDESRQKAIDTFEKDKPFMHPTTVGLVQMLINTKH